MQCIIIKHWITASIINVQRQSSACHQVISTKLLAKLLQQPNNSTNLSTVWRTAKRMDEDQKPEVNESTLENNEDKAEAFAKCFSDMSSNKKTVAASSPARTI